MGKGSSPRPYSVTQHEYDNRWDAIFGKDKHHCEHCGRVNCPHAIDSAKECCYTVDTQSQQGK
jgi:hypothetical protein